MKNTLTIQFANSEDAEWARKMIERQIDKEEQIEGAARSILMCAIKRAHGIIEPDKDTARLREALRAIADDCDSETESGEAIINAVNAALAERGGSMSTKWTSGPWEIGKRVKSCGSIIHVNVLNSDKTSCICSVYMLRNVPESEAESTLRLISLAPEMAEALRSCLPFVDICRKVTGGEGDIAAANIRALLAKLEE